MNQVTTQQKLGSQVAMTNSEGGFAVTPQTLSDIVEFAKFMCQSNAGIPAFLRNNAPDCAAVTMQAMKWGFDPFSVAQKSYKVKDIIAYEAQLIAAVVNARSGIKGRLRYQFEGIGDDLVCTVTGTLDGEEYSYTSPRAGNITTKNSPLWKTDPQQQLGYYSSRNWARRYCPEVLLGVYDREEAEEFRGPDHAKDITSQVIEDPLSDEPIFRPQMAQDARSGPGAVYGADEPHDALTGEIIEPQNAGEEIPAPSADDADPATAASEGDGTPPSQPSPSNPLPAELRQHLMDFARNASKIVEDTSLTDDGKSKTIEKMVLNYQDVIDQADWGKISAITVPLRAVFAGKRTMKEARKFIAGDLLDCSVEEIGG